MADSDKSVDNGANFNALVAAREALSDAPEMAQFTWRAVCNWESGLDGTVGAPYRLTPREVGDDPPQMMILTDGIIRTVLWCTGCRPDYSWITVPLLDPKFALIDDSDEAVRDLSDHLVDHLAGGPTISEV